MPQAAVTELRKPTLVVIEGGAGSKYVILTNEFTWRAAEVMPDGKFKVIIETSTMSGAEEGVRAFIRAKKIAAAKWRQVKIIVG